MTIQNRGRMQRVSCRPTPPRACRPDEIMAYNVRNSGAQLVPMSSFATVSGSVGPSQIVGFNYYQSGPHHRTAKPATLRATRSTRWNGSTGQLPRGFGFEWTGQIAAGEASGAQAPRAAGAVGAAGVPGAGGARTKAGPFRSRCC